MERLDRNGKGVAVIWRRSGRDVAARIVLAAAAVAASAAPLRPCTIAVISGRITADGRPLLWKNRDVTNQNTVVRFFSGNAHAFLGLTDAGVTDKIFAGLNDAGLAVVNAVSSDLEGVGDSENGVIIKRILEECAAVDEVDALLAATNAAGRRTQANFGVIDARGGGAIFETGNRSYARFDVTASPDGFIVRTNFALSGADPSRGEGFIRYARASAILGPAAPSRTIDVRFLFDRAARDLVNEDVDPYPLPFRGTQDGHSVGRIDTSTSINRYRTSCAVVVQGADAAESPLLATMWCVLGEPVCGVALPLWVRAGSVPYEFCGSFTSPLRDAVKAREKRGYDDPSGERWLDTRLLADARGRGLAALIRGLESFIFPSASAALAKWRSAPPAAAAIRDFQNRLASWAYRRYVSGSILF